MLSVNDMKYLTQRGGKQLSILGVVAMNTRRCGYVRVQQQRQGIKGHVC
jgi:hypothetical protein